MDRQQSPAPQQQSQMIMCPVRVMYDTQVLMPPGEQQNQMIYIPQNPMPWNNQQIPSPVMPQNQVVYIQQFPPQLNQVVTQQQMNQQMFQMPTIQQQQMYVPQQIMPTQVMNNNLPMTVLTQNQDGQIIRQQILQQNLPQIQQNLVNQVNQSQNLVYQQKVNEVNPQLMQNVVQHPTMVQQRPQNMNAINTMNLQNNMKDLVRFTNPQRLPNNITYRPPLNTVPVQRPMNQIQQIQAMVDNGNQIHRSTPNMVQTTNYVNMTRPPIMRDSGIQTNVPRDPKQNFNGKKPQDRKPDKKDQVPRQNTDTQKSQPQIINQPQIVNQPQIINHPQIVNQPQIINQNQLINNPHFTTMIRPTYVQQQIGQNSQNIQNQMLICNQNIIPRPIINAIPKLTPDPVKPRPMQLIPSNPNFGTAYMYPLSMEAKSTITIEAIDKRPSPPVNKQENVRIQETQTSSKPTSKSSVTVTPQTSVNVRKIHNLVSKIDENQTNATSMNNTADAAKPVPDSIPIRPVLNSPSKTRDSIFPQARNRSVGLSMPTLTADIKAPQSTVKRQNPEQESETESKKPRTDDNTKKLVTVTVLENTQPPKVQAKSEVQEEPKRYVHLDETKPRVPELRDTATDMSTDKPSSIKLNFYTEVNPTEPTPMTVDNAAPKPETKKTIPKLNEIKIENTPKEPEVKTPVKGDISKQEDLKTEVKDEKLSPKIEKTEETKDAPKMEGSNEENKKDQICFKSQLKHGNIWNINNDSNGFILTHVLDGFVIQESNHAFPIRKPLQERTPPNRTVNFNLRQEFKDTVQNNNNNNNNSKKTEDIKITKSDLENGSEETTEENPFSTIDPKSVKSWETEQLTRYLTNFGWNDTAALFLEQEMDGESLFLCTATQLIAIGVNEERANLICSYIRGK